MSALQRLLVIGGNGFVGSHVCKAALGRGWDVTSMSSSGTPFRTPAGHMPGWTSSVQWKAANALKPDTYTDLVRDKSAVVHTIGTLLPNTQYKDALRRGDIPALLGAFYQSMRGSNPLSKDSNLYDSLNRDTALRVFETYAADTSISDKPRTFIFLSAADVFQPVVPARYIESKREAETELARLAAQASIRVVFVRPGLMYHAHQRPLTSPLAALLSASATAHSSLGKSVPLPTPAAVMKALSFQALGNALETHPLHVEHVARAICAAVEDETIVGPLEVPQIRALVGWKDDTSFTPAQA